MLPPTNPLETLKHIVVALEKADCKYCLIGGHAASLYRSQERLTRDVDIAIVTSDPKEARNVAERCLEAIGLRPMVGFIPAGEFEPKRKSVCLITSEPPPNRQKGVIDILLPVLPWIPEAVKRAQRNRIDLGFATVPVITPEDLIVSKCYALRNSPDRFQDLDDLKDILNNYDQLDREYLRNRLAKLGLTIPKVIKHSL